MIPKESWDDPSQYPVCFSIFCFKYSPLKWKYYLLVLALFVSRISVTFDHKDRCLTRCPRRREPRGSGIGVNNQSVNVNGGSRTYVHGKFYVLHNNLETNVKCLHIHHCFVIDINLWCFIVYIIYDKYDDMQVTLQISVNNMKKRKKQVQSAKYQYLIYLWYVPWSHCFNIHPHKCKVHVYYSGNVHCLGFLYFWC